MATIKKYNGSTWENTTARKYETKSEIITPPTTIYTDGTAITSYLISGNTVQNGTPTPTNPVEVNGVGTLDSGQYKIPISSGGVTTNIYLGSTQTTRQIEKYVFDGTQSIYSCVRTTDNQNYCCVFRFSDIGMTDIKDYFADMSGIDYPIFISDRFVNKDSSKRAYYNNVSAGEMGANNTGTGWNRYVIFCVSGLTTAEDYQTWFAEHPTTIYYILGTATTAAVNEPLMKIGDYVDTLSNAAQIPTTEGANSITVDTTVQPSEFTATWSGWHDSSVKEYDGTNWQ